MRARGGALLALLLAAFAPTGLARAQEPSAADAPWSEYKARKAALVAGGAQAERDFEAFAEALGRRLEREARALARRADELAREPEDAPAPPATGSAARAGAAATLARVRALGACLEAELGPPAAEAEQERDEALALAPAALLERVHYASWAFARALRWRVQRAREATDALAHAFALARCTAAFDEDGAGRAALEHAWAELLRGARRDEEALAVVERALAAPADARVRPYLLLTRAELLRTLERHEEALASLAELEEGEPASAEEREARAWVDGLRAQVLLDLGQPERAAPVLRREHEAAEAAPRDERSLPRLFAARAGVMRHARAVGDHERALALARAFLAEEALYAEHPREHARTALLAGLSVALLARAAPERAEEARALLAQADALALEGVTRLEARLGRADLALRAGQLAQARAELDVARAALDALGAGRELAGEVYAAADLAGLEVRLALASGADADALRALEPPLRAALAALEASWRARPRSRAGAGLLLYRDRRAALGAWIRLALAAHPGEAGRARALDGALRLEAASTLALERDAEPASVAALRAELCAPGTGVLVFVPDDGATHAFALDREELVHATLPDLDALARARAELAAQHDAFAFEPPGAEAVARERELARALAALALPPALEARLERWSRVVLVGDDAFGGLPLAWLPGRGGERLGRGRALERPLSLALALALAREPLPGGQRERESPAQPPRRELVLVGGALAQESARAAFGALAPLPLGAELAGELASAWEAGPREILSGNGATPAALARSLHDSVAALALLVHGVQDPLRARSGGLVLSGESGDDGLLWCEAVERLAAPPCVLVLGCASGMGARRRGDAGASDLGGAFLRAGARSVLVCDTTLGYRTAVELARALLAALSRGADPASALAQAEDELAREDPGGAPFRLAGLRLVGLGDRPLVADRPPARGWGAPALALGVVLLLALALVLVRVLRA